MQDYFEFGLKMRYILCTIKYKTSNTNSNTVLEHSWIWGEAEPNVNDDVSDSSNILIHT
jgi:hypothetical protein